MKKNQNQITINSNYYFKSFLKIYFHERIHKKKLIELWKVPWFFKISRTMVIVSKLVIWKYWEIMSKWVYTHLVTIGYLSFILKIVEAWYGPPPKIVYKFNLTFFKLNINKERPRSKRLKYHCGFTWGANVWSSSDPHFLIRCLLCHDVVVLVYLAQNLHPSPHHKSDLTLKNASLNLEIYFCKLTH